MERGINKVSEDANQISNHAITKVVKFIRKVKASLINGFSISKVGDFYLFVPIVQELVGLS